MFHVLYFIKNKNISQYLFVCDICISSLLSTQSLIILLGLIMQVYKFSLKGQYKE